MMKNLCLLLLLTFGLFLSACDKEERVCVKTDFIGDFLGVTTCQVNGGTGPGVATVIRVTDGTVENEVIVEIDGITIAVRIDGCNFSGSDQNADVDLTFSGNLDGETIKVKLEGTALGANLDCESEGEKN